MKSREQGGVVDERLNVYGTQGLKVAGMLFCMCCPDAPTTDGTQLNRLEHFACKCWSEHIQYCFSGW